MVAVEEMQRGLVDADLGGGLLKKRIAQLIHDGELQEIKNGKPETS